MSLTVCQSKPKMAVEDGIRVACWHSRAVAQPMLGSDAAPGHSYHPPPPPCHLQPAPLPSPPPPHYPQVSDPQGNFWASNIVAAYDYAHRMGAHVVSCRWGLEIQALRACTGEDGGGCKYQPKPSQNQLKRPGVARLERMEGGISHSQRMGRGVRRVGRPAAVWQRGRRVVGGGIGQDNSFGVWWCDTHRAVALPLRTYAHAQTHSYTHTHTHTYTHTHTPLLPPSLPSPSPVTVSAPTSPR